MRARAGDRIVLAAPHTSEATRAGVVREVRGDDGQPPYVVTWSDGHEGVFYPGAGAVLRVTPGENAAAVDRSGAPASSEESEHSEQSEQDDAPSGRPRVRDWQVRVTVFERGDHTDAHVVLLSDAPGHLRAEGHTRRSDADLPAPEVGDEVAVARALRGLADLLLQTAEQDIRRTTGTSSVTVRA